MGMPSAQEILDKERFLVFSACGVSHEIPSVVETTMNWHSGTIPAGTKLALVEELTHEEALAHAQRNSYPLYDHGPFYKAIAE